MPIFNIDCEGETHRIEIDEEGNIFLYDHDVDEELALVEIGEEPPWCVALVIRLAEDPEGVLEERSEAGDAQGVKMALAAGADVHAGDDCALHYAVTYNHADVVRILLKAGADVSADDDGALRYAARNGHADVVRILLKAGANVHAWDDEALRYAARNGHADVVRVIEDWIERHG
jgi:hypothetical protein